MFLIFVGIVFVIIIASAIRHSGVNVYQGRDKTEEKAYIKARDANKRD